MRVAKHDELEPLRIGDTERIFVLTGAGISAESGIRTFRDANGLWESYRFEEVASPEGWRRDPSLVWRFYSQRRAQAKTVEPNPAHTTLAKVEAALGERFFLCTQNVDPLHERAGSKNAVHMHGELMKSRCEKNNAGPGHGAPYFDESLYEGDLPICSCGAKIRPHICWFGEVPFEMDRIALALSACDVFITIGSSGAVYPAAGFVAAVRGRAKTIYVGPEEPDNAEAFHECRLGKAGEAVPRLFGLY